MNWFSLELLYNLDSLNTYKTNFVHILLAARKRVGFHQSPPASHHVELSAGESAPLTTQKGISTSGQAFNGLTFAFERQEEINKACWIHHT